MRQPDHVRLPIYADDSGRFCLSVLRFAWQLQQQSDRSVTAQFREPSRRLQAVRIAPPVGKPAA